MNFRDIPSREEAKKAKSEIERLERKRERLKEKGKNLDKADEEILGKFSAVRKRFDTFLAIAMGGGLTFAGAGAFAVHRAMTDEPAPSTSIPNPALKPSAEKGPTVKNDAGPQWGGEFSFPKVAGVLDKLTPVQTCKVDKNDLMKQEEGPRFMTVMDKCEGRLQKGGTTFLKSSIAGYKINGELVNGLDNAFTATNHATGLPQIAARTFFFHRKDGKDGLPGGNIFDFGLYAMTHADRGISHSLTSIPLDGDKAHAVSSLATEICQTRILAEKDNTKAEIACNSFGKAVSSIYAKDAYPKYKEIMENTGFMLKKEAQVHKFRPIAEDVYKKLEKILADQPDILIPAN